MPTIGEGVIKIRSDTSGFGSGITSTLSSIGKTAAATFTVASAAAIGFGVSAFGAAARVGEMDATLRALSKGNAAVYDTMQKTVGAIRSSGIEAGVAQNLVAQFTRNNLDLAKATDLSRVAQDAAVISGRNSTEVLGDLVHGITTQNSLVLRNAGINVQAGQAMETFAKGIGKTTKELTDSERSQAVLNAVIAAGIPIAGAYAAAMEEPGKVLRSFPRVFDDIKVAVGKPLVDAFGPTILAAYDFAKALSASLQPGGALNGLVVAIGEKLHGAIKPLTDFIGHAKTFIKTLKPGDIKGIAGAFDSLGPAAASAGAGFFAFGAKSLPVIGNLLGGVNPLMVAFGALALTSADVRDGLGGVIKVVVPLAKELLGVLMPAFNDLVKALTPILGLLVEVAAVIIGSLLKAFAPLVPVVVEVAKVIVDLIEHALLWLTPVIGDVLRIAGDLAKILADVLLDAIVDLAPLFHDLLDVLGPIANTMIKDLEPVFKDLAGVLADLLPLLLPVVSALISLATEALKPLEPILGPVAAGLLAVYGAFKLISAAQGIQKAIGGFKLAEVGLYKMGVAAWASLGPWGLLIGAVVGIGAALYVAYTKFEPFRHVVDTIGRTIRDVTTAIVGFVAGGASITKKFGPLGVLLEGLVNPIRGLVQAIQGVIDIVKGALAGDWSKVWEGLKKVAEGVLRAMFPALVAIVTNFGPKILEALAGIASTIGDFFAGLGTTIWDALVGVGETVVRFFTELPGKIVDALKALPGLLYEAAITAIALFITGLIYQWYIIPKKLTELVVDMVKALAELGPKLARAGAAAMVAFATAIASGAVAVWDFFLKLPGRVQGYLSSAGGWLVDAGARLLNGLWNGITTGAAAVWSFFVGLPARLKGYFTTAVTWLAAAGSSVATGLYNGITSAISALWGFLAGLPHQVKTMFNGAGTWLIESGKAIIRGLIQGIKDMVGAVGGAMGDIGNKIKGFLPNSPQAKEGPLSGHGATFYAGQEIVAGLVRGLEDMIPSVAGAMDDMLALPDTGGSLPPAGRAVARGGPGGAATGAGPSYTLNIYPQALDEQGVLDAFHRLELIGAIR